MANHALPTTTSLYTDVLTNLKDRIDDSLKMLDSVNTSPTNVPTNSIRWNSTTTLWEKYDGSSWISLAASYAIKVLKSSNLVGGNSTTLLGSIPYQSNTDTTTLLAPNTTTTRKFLRQTGTGTNGAAPVWDTILASDIPTLNQNTTGSAGSCTGNSATATTATNVSGGTVNATTGTFSGELATETQIVIGTGGDSRRGAIYSDPQWGMLFRAKVDTPNIAHFVWVKGDGNELFRHNGTALTTNITGNAATATKATSAGSCTGNSATATKLTSSQNDWSASEVISNVVGMLAWKNYGNGHVIFDASNGTSPTGSAVNNTNSNVAWSQSLPTLMGWNGGTTFGVRVDSARVSDNGLTALSMAGNGYLKFGGGLIIQWGTYSGALTHGTSYTATFPIAFPNACLKVIGQYGNTTVSTLSGVGFQKIMQMLTNSFTFQWGWQSGGTAQVDVNYVAIGY